MTTHRGGFVGSMEGESVGFSVGLLEGLALMVGEMVGGGFVGSALGFVLGCTDTVGAFDGCREMEGLCDKGLSVGSSDGDSFGSSTSIEPESAQ